MKLTKACTILLIASMVIMLVILLFNYEVFFNGPDLFSAILAQKDENYGYWLGAGEFSFYIVILFFMLLSAYDLARGKKHLTWKMIMHTCLFVLFIILELPLYHRHMSWGSMHGHSFWSGFHFH